MDALQNDIDTLEREKADTKKRLDAYSKKSLLADLARHASSSSGIAAVVAGTFTNSFNHSLTHNALNHFLTDTFICSLKLLLTNCFILVLTQYGQEIYRSQS